MVNETFGSDVHTTQQFTSKFGSLLLEKIVFFQKNHNEKEISRSLINHSEYFSFFAPLRFPRTYLRICGD